MNNIARRIIPIMLLVVLSASVSLGQEVQVPGDQATGDGASAGSALKATSDSAPNPPDVVCKDNQLTISANNSTLGSVLAAVHTCVGLQIELPPSLAGSRIFEQLGPSSVREVLTSLLSETGFDYVISSSDSNPDQVETVLLMVRAKERDTTNMAASERTLTPARRAWMQSLQNGRSANAQFDDDSPVVDDVPIAIATDESAAKPKDSAATNASQTPTSNQGPVVADVAQVLAESPTSKAVGAGLNPSQPAGTQDPISNMQQLFEQRRQMIEKQNTSRPQ